VDDDDPGRWCHRGPCTVHWCAICGSGDCYAWNDDDPGSAEVHICAAGCDGWPPRLMQQAT
jgi:hypothetical protein